MEIDSRDLTKLDGTPSGYLATPRGEPAQHGIVLIPEYWGLVEHIRDVARRLAGNGFAAMALDLFDGRTAAEPDEGRRLAQSLDHDVAIERVREAVAEVRADHVAPGGSVGVLGWCMGGTLAFRSSVSDVGADAIVGFYGEPGDTQQISASRTPTLGIFGAEDHVYEPARIRQAAAQLTESSDRHRFVLATAAKHGFFNDTRASYEADSASWAWELTQLWFKYWFGAAATDSGPAAQRA